MFYQIWLLLARTQFSLILVGSLIYPTLKKLYPTAPPLPFTARNNCRIRECGFLHLVPAFLWSTSGKQLRSSRIWVFWYIYDIPCFRHATFCSRECVYLLLWAFVLTSFRHCVDIPISVRLVWLILAYPCTTTEASSPLMFASAAQNVQAVEADTTLTEVTRSVQPVVVRDLLFGSVGASLNMHGPYPPLGKFSLQRASEGSMWSVELYCRLRVR